jgi:hypothetical protein
MTTPDDSIPLEPEPTLMDPNMPSGVTGLVDTEDSGDLATEDTNPEEQIPYPRGPGEPAESPTPDGPIPTEP